MSDMARIWRHGLAFQCVGRVIAACSLSALCAPRKPRFLYPLKVSHRRFGATALVATVSPLTANLRCVAGLMPQAFHRNFAPCVLSPFWL